MATENLSADTAGTTTSALRDLEEQLSGWKNELFDVHALLLAIRARLDKFEESDGISCDASDELGRLIRIAARDVNRLACGGAA
jgi:hypothetical protein